MLKLCTTFIALGLGVGTAVSAKRVVGDLLHDLDDVALTMATVPVIQPTTANAIPSLAEADRLVQIAEELNISSKKLHALAQDAASDCDGITCMEIMIAVWGPAWAEQVLRARSTSELAANQR